MAEPDELPDAVEENVTATAPIRRDDKKDGKTSSAQKKASKSQTFIEVSLRKPQWAYIQLRYLSSSSSSEAGNKQPIDAVTAHLHLTAALSSFLGAHGSAVPIDILKVERQDVWIRVPAEDRAVVLAAAGGWTNRSGNGWRAGGWSHWDANALSKDAGEELYR